MGRLNECVKYLELSIDLLKQYWEKNGTKIIIEQDQAKLEEDGTRKLKKVQQWNDLLMKYRYLTKFNLQLWAVLSQLSEYV